MKKVLTIIFVFVSAINIAQSKWAAEKQFNNFNYMKSAELYEKIYKKGDKSFEVISRIADSYYLNSRTEESASWYKILFDEVAEEEIPAEYYFKFAQSLKSIGNYKESDNWLKKFRAESADDSRGKGIETNANYLSELTKDREKIIQLNNLSINTSYSDFGSFMSGNTLVFSSTRTDSLSNRKKMYKWNNQPFLNMYSGTEVKRKTDRSDVSLYDVIDAKNISSVNSQYHDATAILTKDGNTKYFTRNNFDKKLKKDKDRVVHLKLYKAEKVNNNWENITELPFNSDEYSTGHPALSVDEKTLYFISDMPSSIGQTDIFKVQINDDGTYGEPENLGNAINTEGKEMFPYIGSDNTLYFSSDGHLGLGLLDVFSSELINDTYKAIQNMGSPFNSTKDDFSFVINSDKEHGYLSSNREGGKGDDDIYSFTISDPCTQKVVGIVVNKETGNPLPNSLVSFYDSVGKEIKSVRVGDDAKYSFEANCESEYRIVGIKEYYASDENVVQTANEIGETTSNLELALNPDFTEKNGDLMVDIEPIYFDFDKSNIREDAAKILDKLASLLNKYPKLKIELSSHTDWRGSNAYNDKLSQRRAKSTIDYLVEKGISSERITGQGYGETRTVNKCVNGVDCSEDEHQLNRRSEFIVINN